MRRFLYILGSLTLVVFVVAIVGFGLVAYKGNELDAESRAFVDNALRSPLTGANKSFSIGLKLCRSASG